MLRSIALPNTPGEDGLCRMTETWPGCGGGAAMRIFAEIRSGRPSPFRSPAATELVSVKGGITVALSLLQASSAKRTHMAISRHADDEGRSFPTITPQERRR